jgi:transcription-repair coupling factor (superfamily II helicase)
MITTAESKTEIARLRERIERGTKIISLGGLTSIAAKAFVLSHLQRETRKTFVVVADSNKDLENWECDLNFWVKSKKADSQILSLPSFETDIYSGVSPHAETLEKRALTLWNLSFSQPDFLVTSAKSLITRTVSPPEIRNLGAVLKRDEDYSPDDLIEKLVGSGYVRAEPIANIGEFSVRGGILDVWSPSAQMPVRIEFFGDTVDSIRQFDPDTPIVGRAIKGNSFSADARICRGRERFPRLGVFRARKIRRRTICTRRSRSRRFRRRRRIFFRLGIFNAADKSPKVRRFRLSQRCGFRH